MSNVCLFVQIIKQLDEADAQLQPDIDDLLERYHAGEFDEKKRTKKNKRVLAQMEVERYKVLLLYIAIFRSGDVWAVTPHTSPLLKIAIEY